MYIRRLIHHRTPKGGVAIWFTEEIKPINDKNKKMTSGLRLEPASRSAQCPRLCPSTTYGRFGGLGRSSRSCDEFEVSLGYKRPCLNKQPWYQLYILTGASL